MINYPFYILEVNYEILYCMIWNCMIHIFKYIEYGIQNIKETWEKKTYEKNGVSTSEQLIWQRSLSAWLCVALDNNLNIIFLQMILLIEGEWRRSLRE